MRAQKSITLGDGRTATVLELRVRDMRLLLDRMAGREALDAAWIVAHLAELMALAADSVLVSDGAGLDDLTLSEFEAVTLAWWEMHQRFFGLVAALFGQAAVSNPASSTAPVSPSPNPATAASGTTDGPCT